MKLCLAILMYAGAAVLGLWAGRTCAEVANIADYLPVLRDLRTHADGVSPEAMLNEALARLAKKVE